MIPPGRELVEQIKAQAAILDRMIAEAEQGDAVIAAAETLLKAYQKTQS